MAPSNFPGQYDSLPLVTGGVTYPDADTINYLTAAISAIEDSLGEAPTATPPGSGITMKGTLLELFAEFFRIECGEMVYRIDNPPLVDDNINDQASGQNSIQSNQEYNCSSELGVGGTLNTSCFEIKYTGGPDLDFFNPYVSSTYGMFYGPGINPRNPYLFDTTEDGKFVAMATGVVRMEGQETWCSIQDTASPTPNYIMSSLPEPYDYPTSLSMNLKVDYDEEDTNVGLWSVIGVPAQTNNGWNTNIVSSSGDYPFSIKAGTMMHIRYMVMECSWL